MGKLAQTKEATTSKEQNRVLIFSPCLYFKVLVSLLLLHQPWEPSSIWQTEASTKFVDFCMSGASCGSHLSCPHGSLQERASPEVLWDLALLPRKKPSTLCCNLCKANLKLGLPSLRSFCGLGGCLVDLWWQRGRGVAGQSLRSRDGWKGFAHPG